MKMQNGNYLLQNEKSDAPSRLLDRVLRTRSHVAVLRALTYHGGGVSARSMARATGVNHWTCAKVMRELLDLGVLLQARSRRRLRLNADHPVVKNGLLPLFEWEERYNLGECPCA